MLSKNKIKFIQSLSRKKQRDEEQLFLVEGDKLVTEALQSVFKVRMLCATPEFIRQNSSILTSAVEVIETDADELKKASQLQSPQNSLAVLEMQRADFSLKQIDKNLCLALDFIQDPGNLGTIIRLADWFGIEHILCSENTVDCYNPKVIQASMGAILRVKLHYTNLHQTLKEASTVGIPVYGAFLDGENIYREKLSSNGILVMGNEGNGISPEVEKIISRKLHIPSFAGSGSESLNVSMASAICLSEFFRRSIS